MSNKLIIIK